MEEYQIVLLVIFCGYVIPALLLRNLILKGYSLECELEGVDFVETTPSDVMFFIFFPIINIVFLIISFFELSSVKIKLKRGIAYRLLGYKAVDDAKEKERQNKINKTIKVER